MSDFKNRLNPRLGKRERLAVSSTAVGFTVTNGKLANFIINGSSDGKLADRKAEGALLQVGAAGDIIYTLDGTDPDANTGFSAVAGERIVLDSFQQIQNFKALRATVDTTVEALAMFPA